MHESYWGLSRSPFCGSLDVRRFFASPTHVEAMARLHFLASGSRQLGVVVGDWGTGKSLLLETFAHDLRRKGVCVAKADALGLDATGWLSGVAADWGLNPQSEWSPQKLWSMLADRVAEFRYERARAAVLLDNADEACEEVLLQLMRLTQCQAASETHMTVAVTVHAGQMIRLGRRILELTDLRIELTHWDAVDTCRYVEHALAQAGRMTPAFEPAALERLHELTEGVPRRVQQLADLALIAGAGCRLPLVDVHTVETACEELSVPLGGEVRQFSTT